MGEPDNVIRAFSADQVARLTGLSKGQLRYWENLGFFVPHYGTDDRGLPFSRIYSFRDLVGLRTIAILRIDFGVPFQRIRKLAESLSSYDQSVWSDLKVYLRGKDPYLTHPDHAHATDADGQIAPVVLLVDVINDVVDKARKLKERSPEQYGHVERNRFVAHNTWVLSGTRIPTSAIQDFHQAGYSIEEIIKEYPALTRQDIEAAIEHEERLAKSA